MSAATKSALIAGLRVSVGRDALRDALALVNRVVERQCTAPILAYVRITASSIGLTLTATGLDHTASAFIHCSPGACGDTTAPAGPLLKLVSGFTSESVDLADDGERVTVTGGSRVAKLPTLPARNSPAMLPWEPTHRFTMPAADLRKMLDTVIFAISTDEARYYLNGIYLHPTDRSGLPVLVAVATDGHRLALADVPLPMGAIDMPGIIVPRRAVKIARDLIKNAETVDIAIGAPGEKTTTRIRFTAGFQSIEAMTINGDFPEYQRVITKLDDLPNRLRLPAKVLGDAVKGVTSIGLERRPAVKFGMSSGRVLVSYADANHCECADYLMAEFDGAPFTIGFNGRYVTDVTKRIPAAVEICMSDRSGQAIFRDPADASAMFVLMPMRV